MKRREFLGYSSAFLGATLTFGTFGTQILAADSKDFFTNTQGANMQYVTLNNGLKMPLLGFGTYDIKSIDTFLAAVDCGYRLFDSAQMYGNQKEVGAAIREAIRSRGIKREEFFITTKLSSGMDFESAKKSIESSLKALDIGYIDLLLIHAPYTQAKEMYKAMELAYKEGIIKALGISSFTPKVYLEFIKTCEIMPAINQCETHIYYQQRALLEAMKPYGTILESWSPFIAGKSGFFDNPTLRQIASAHNKSVAQIALRFLVQQGIIAIPKASKLKHMQENINVFDFSLSAADMESIRALDKNKTQFSWGY
ncbi:oxidoreductase, aldo/keto reductase family [Helicobacter pullorum]|uniref:aldo/keto reductase n=1 Tax=Helicobacter pullorum TaxID=35818 RepID=UPI000F6F44B3|nr:aldo/keto reductase [Helicobacter pullorum]VEJ08202.1 oxidoreductase, aldo/keto reductase family [Helicobacter pullorum]